MATKLHLGGDLSGQTVEAPDTFSYVSTGGTTYVVETMHDGKEIFVDGELCKRDANNIYMFIAAKAATGGTPTPGIAPQDEPVAPAAEKKTTTPKA